MIDRKSFLKTRMGFNIYCRLRYLSHIYCLAYCHEVARRHGEKMKYRNMSPLRMAQEVWFHACVYYCGIGLRKLGLRHALLDKWITQAYYIEVDENDARIMVFVLAWWLCLACKVIFAIWLLGFMKFI